MQRAYGELTEAVAEDENLTELLGEMNELIEVEGIPAQAGQQKLLWLTRAWNQYLDENGAKYFLRGFIVRQPEPVLQLYAHEVVGDGMVTVDGDDVRVRFVSRLDEVNRYAPYHASEPSEGAAVLSDRLVLFATERVWPLLASEPESPKGRRAQAFRDTVVAEVEAGLPSAFPILKATADVRAAAVRVRAEMWDRHHSCNRYVLKNQPWNGFDEATLDKLQVRLGSGACPVVYARELAALAELSNVAANTERLEDAVGQLVAWVGRLDAIHEARHYMDRIDVYDDDAKVVCKICSGSDGPMTRGEVSAILAEFAWSDAPATALYRRCSAEGKEPSRATEVIFEELKWSCSEGPHPNLATAAREQAEIGFDRDAPVEIVELPSALPLVRSADRPHE